MKTKAKLIALIFASIGLLLDVVLLIYSLINKPVPCLSGNIDNIQINCSKVLNSNFSSFLGIKLSFLALIWFVLLILSLLFLSNYHKFELILLIFGVVGILFVIYSLITQMSYIQALCIYCIGMDASLLGYFILSVISFIKKI
ncbi:MAG: vitamin K epoxide reductase family protein [Candidatus Rehaiarchaeum fermentans]|nr:vitamin K epoxide reductase family protein [Candidatus Rehaiarchaeum fermentans]